ncbi:MAG: hypothetical protein WD845_12080 [Pirellulales bacterium]
MSNERSIDIDGRVEWLAIPRRSRGLHVVSTARSNDINDSF